MYVDRILKVAEAIELDTVKGVKFDMNHFNFNFLESKHRCIAGYVQELFPDEFQEGITHYKNTEQYETTVLGEFLATNYVLGIEQPKGVILSTSFPLYFPQNVDMNYADITRDQAVEVLRRFAETGKIEWDLVDAPTAA